jgi:nitrogen fixation/metabolism regulation signal transduction histidine kinase
MTLFIASLLTLLVAFGVGWLFSGYVLRPIQRIT